MCIYGIDLDYRVLSSPLINSCLSQSNETNKMSSDFFKIKYKHFFSNLVMHVACSTTTRREDLDRLLGYFTLNKFKNVDELISMMESQLNRLIFWLRRRSNMLQEVLEANTFVKPIALIDRIDYNKTIKRSNYTNLCLQTVGKQMTRIEDKVDKIIDKIINKSLNSSVKSSSLKDLDPVNIKPPVDTKFTLSPKRDDEFIKKLMSQLKDLKLSDPPHSSQNISIIDKNNSDSESEFDNLKEISNHFTQLNDELNSNNNTLHLN